MSLTLRPDQAAMRQSGVDLLRRGVRRLLFQAPTGFGKTVLAAHMLANAATKGHDAWFCLHRRELVKQSIRTFRKSDLAHGVIARGFTPDRRPSIQIASIGTLAKRLDLYGPPRLIILDECHHVAAASWARLVAAFPDAVLIGLSATPQRLDGVGLREWFDEIVPGPSVRQLIEEQSLSPFRILSPGIIDTTGMHSRMGEFIGSELRAAVDKPKITGDAIAHYRKHCDGAMAAAFCVSIEHSKHVAERFCDAGIPAKHVDGDTHPDERDKAIEDFEAGKIKILTNVDLFGEGFDVPGMEAMIDLSPTMSLTKYLQRCGRPLRYVPGKEAILLDAAGNRGRHGDPDDEREWSLDGMRTGKKKVTEDAIRKCPMCYADIRAEKMRCDAKDLSGKICGFEFETRPREVDEVDGELTESPEAREKRLQREDALREQGRARSIEELTEVGRRRGMKNPEGWARHLIEAREMKKQRGIAA